MIEPEAPATLAREREPLFEEEAPAPQEVPLPNLPLEFSADWTLERGTTGMLQLTRRPQAARADLRRALWYIFWAAAYVFLIVGSHFSGIAPPGQPWLPPLAALSVVVLLALIARNLLSRRNAPDVYIFDSYQGQIRAATGVASSGAGRAGQIQSLYVSEQLHKRRGAAAPPVHAELNLHLSSNRFQHLLQSRQSRHVARESVAAQPGVSELRSWHCSTNTQAVALHVAQAMELPVWLDRRES